MALRSIQLLSQVFIGICSCLVLIITIHTSDSYAQASPASTDTKIRNIDGVVAVVNTGVVTRKEVDDRIASLQKQGPVGGKKLPEGEHAFNVNWDAPNAKWLKEVLLKKQVVTFPKDIDFLEFREEN